MSPDCLPHQVQDADGFLRQKPEGIGQFVEYAIFLRRSAELFDKLSRRWEHSNECHELCAEFEIAPSEGAKATRKALAEALTSLSNTIGEHESGYTERLASWTERVGAALSALRTRAADERLLAEAPLLFDGSTAPADVFAHLEGAKGIVNELLEAAAQLERWQSSLQLPVVPCDEVKSLTTALRIATELWNCVDDGEKAKAARAELPLAHLEPSEMEAATLRYTRALSQAERGMPPNTVVPRLKALIDESRSMLPVVVSVRTPHLKPAHYNALEKALAAAVKAEKGLPRAAVALAAEPLPRGEQLTYRVAVERRLHVHNGLVAKMAYDASQEAVLRDRISNRWRLMASLIALMRALTDGFRRWVSSLSAGPPRDDGQGAAAVEAVRVHCEDLPGRQGPLRARFGG